MLDTREMLQKKKKKNPSLFTCFVYVFTKYSFRHLPYARYVPGSREITLDKIDMVPALKKIIV